MVKLAVGSVGDSFSVGSLKAYLSEFIATLLFVFAGVGSAIAFSKFQVLFSIGTVRTKEFSLFVNMQISNMIDFDGIINRNIFILIYIISHDT